MIKYLRLVFTVGFRILWDYLFFINGYARHPERTPLKVRYKKIRKLIVYVLDHYRIDWKLKGMENLLSLKGKCYLLVANHLSDLDPLAIVYLSEEPISFVAKVETLKMPFIGKAVKALDGLFLDRKDLRQGLNLAQTLEKRLETSYCSYMIFPEGTRNKEPLSPVAEFHPGSMKGPLLAGVPILPVATYGTFRPFHPRPDYRRNPVSFNFYPPIFPSGFAGKSTCDLAELTQKMISDGVEEEKDYDKRYFEQGLQKIPLRKGVLDPK